MSNSVLKQIADLENRTHEELKMIWCSLNGTEPPAYNRQFIIKRLSYRIQELRHGGLPESTRDTMRDLLKQQGFDEYGVPRRPRASQLKHRDGMPIPGTRLIRDWNGNRYEVTVSHSGFEYDGRRYRSLSAIAKVITGTHWNGRAFFGLQDKKEKVG
jgi:hypothetical protein